MAPVLTGQDPRRGKGVLRGIMRKIRPTPVGGCIQHRIGAMLDANFGGHFF